MGGREGEKERRDAMSRLLFVVVLMCMHVFIYA